MTRTTPPRPVAITELFPELEEHSATATRLHPRPGAPTAADSSVGGQFVRAAATAHTWLRQLGDAGRPHRLDR
jgi:hypothetical protein